MSNYKIPLILTNFRARLSFHSKLAAIAFVSATVVSCSAPPKVVKQTPQLEPEVAQPENIVDPNYAVIEAITELNQARQYEHERNIIERLRELPEPPNDDLINWLLARSYFSENNISQALIHAEQVDVRQLPPYLYSGYFQTLGNYYDSVDPIKSAGYWIDFSALVPEEDEQKQAQAVEFIWQLLNKRNTYQSNIINTATISDASAWVELINIHRQFGWSQEQFAERIQTWQQRFSSSLVAQHLPRSVLKAMNSQHVSAKKIAVLLPLSGQRKALGVAIRDGLVMASMQQSTASINFIDSESLQWSELETQLATAEIDFVIGPLLKSNIALYRQQPLSPRPTMFLNSIDSLDLMPDNLYQFALNPDEEIEQAVQALLQKGFQTPIVIAPENSTGQRLSQKFVQTWEYLKVDQNTPQISFFTNSKSMETNIRKQLGVDESLARIKALKAILVETIDTETRNRRDIDMAYIIASPTQSRLVKPFIDVNISPFAERIPVYASSRSYTYSDNGNEVRDLTGMVFTDMPWIIQSRSEPDYHQLQSDVWPQRDTNEFRLFALGYDAWMLVDKIGSMRDVQQLSYQGLTGLLGVNEQGLVKRQLAWGRVNRTKVQMIAMD